MPSSSLQSLFTEYLKKTISVRDTFVKKPTKENFYHGILLGILAYKAGWTVSSNKEAGDGFSDIMIQIDESDTGIIIEIKYAESSLEAECKKAILQIDRKQYEESLLLSELNWMWWRPGDSDSNLLPTRKFLFSDAFRIKIKT